MRPIQLVLVACLFCPIVAVRAESPTTGESAKPASTAIDGQLRSDIGFLASDALRGRSVDDTTIDEAADFIADRMREIGLRTDIVEGTPFQTVLVTLGARPGSTRNNRVVVTSGQGNDPPISAALDDGMNPLAIGSSSGQVSGPLVFAGFGITAPNLSYDDYQGIDVTGATVLIFRKEPGASDPNSRFSGTRNTRHAFFRTKIDNAIKHGAAAVIFVNDPSSVLHSVQNEKNKIDSELKRKQAISMQLQALPEEAVNNRKTLRDKISGIDSMVESLRRDLARAERGVMEIGEAGERPNGKDAVPVVSMARDLVDQILKRSTGRSLEEIEQQINETTKPQSVVLKETQVSLRVELQPTSAPSKNVIGVLDGEGELAGESVIVGAHYDHVGMGGYGSLAPGTIAVHNGADDNASGTAAMLAIANRLRQRLGDVASHRRVVFLAFTGEERGLIGSKHYVRQPLFPLESTAVMINLDMVGRLRDNELTVYGTGSGDLLDELVERANEQQSFRLFKVQTGYGPSDHQSFYQAGIPVLFFFTGLHNDYHRPSDDVEKIEFEGLNRVTQIVTDVTFDLVTGKERPRYAETENRVTIRRQMTAFLGVSLSDQGDHVILSALTAGGPAEQAGMKVGDRLEKLGKRHVQSSSDVLEWMRSRSPGDDVNVQVRRGRRTVDLEVKLTARPGR